MFAEREDNYGKLGLVEVGCSGVLQRRLRQSPLSRENKKKIGFPKKTSERSTTGNKFTSTVTETWRPGVIRPG
jgi:hypothetical protein